MVVQYRRTITVALGRGATGSLLLDLLADDGAVVYINGREVAKWNMSPGTLVPATRVRTGLTQ